MSKHYTLLSETKVPMRDGDESFTTIRMYHIDEERYDFLCNVRSYQRDDGTYGPHNPAPDEVCDAICVEMVVMEDLGLVDNGYVAPGALYHSYDVTIFNGVALIADTVAYNV